MSFNYTENPIRIDINLGLKDSADYMRTVHKFNATADAIVLAAGRMQVATDNDSFVEEFASLCNDYRLSSPEQGVLIAEDINALVKREYPSVGQLAEFEYLLGTFENAVKALNTAVASAETVKQILELLNSPAR
jgi:hypothetical protein